MANARGGRAAATLIDDLPLFSAARTAPPAPAPSPRLAALEAALREVLPDQMTPREALDLVYRLKEMLENP